MIKPPPGSRVKVLRGRHAGMIGTVVEDPGIVLQVGGRDVATPICPPGQVLVKFDNDVREKGRWDTDLFNYNRYKLKVISPLEQLAECAE